MDTYLPHVGHVLFPRGPGDLTPQVCPACFTPRGAATCPRCGLNLASPLIADLTAESVGVAQGLDRRLELIGRIRFESAAAAPAVAAPLPPRAAPAPMQPGPVVAGPVIEGPVTAGPVQPVRDAPPRRHLGVQVILLIVGVSLLSVGAIFFLVYALITFGLVWRSVIIAAVTVASFVGATLLRRRRLGATAEAIAALAVVFVLLDIFALRANDLFGAQAADGLTYWGTALIVSAAGFTAWHRASGLRLPSLVAATVFAPALALLAGGVSTGLDDEVRLFIASLVLAVGTLVHGVVRPGAERRILLVEAILGLAAAAIVAVFVEPDLAWAPVVTMGLIVVASAAHVGVLLRRGSAGRFAGAFASIGALVAASTLAVVASRLGEQWFSAAVPLVAASIVALALERVARRSSARLASALVAWVAAGVAGVALLVSTASALFDALAVVTLGADRWRVDGGWGSPSDAGEVATVVGLAVVVALVGIAWASAGTIRNRRSVIVSAAAAVLVLSAPLAGLLWVTVLTWILLAATAAALLLSARERSWTAGIRLAVAVGGAVAMVFGYLASWGSIDTWWIGSLGAIAVLLVARLATASPVVRAPLLGLATVLALVAVGAEAWHLNEELGAGAGAELDSVHAVALLAVVLLAASAVVARAVSVAEARVLVGLSLVAALGSSAIAWVTTESGAPTGLVLPTPAIDVVIAAALLVPLLGWVLGRRGPDLEGAVMAAAIAPAAAWWLLSVARLIDLPASAAIVAPAAAAMVVAAAAVAVRRLRPAWDAGVALVLVPTVAFGAGVAETGWLVLVLAGVAVVLLAASRDGLFASSSPRKHLGWLALALAFAGLARALADRGVLDLEPYVLPLAGALLLIAFATWRADRTGSAPAIIALAALLVAILPLGAQATSGSPVRAVIIFAVSGAFLLGSRLRRGSFSDAAAAAGVVGVLIVGLGRPFVTAAAGDASDVTVDWWVVAAITVLVIGALLQPDRPRRRIASQVVVAVAITAAAVFELAVARDNPAGPVRVFVTVAVLSAIYVAGMLAQRAPFTRVVGWIALGLASIVAVAGSVVGAIDPFEWTTAIIAAALLAAGAVMLHRRADAGSWPWLAPGLIVLLLPSLTATFSDQPIWRLVGIGVACVIAILVGAVRQLQAPLVIGSVVVLVHAVRTFSPQLVAVYQLTEWWVWAVVGGAIIIFVAVTFERRVRDLRTVGGRLAALR